MKINWAKELRKAIKATKPVSQGEYEKQITLLCKKVRKNVIQNRAHTSL